MRCNYISGVKSNHVYIGKRHYAYALSFTHYALSYTPFMEVFSMNEAEPKEWCSSNASHSLMTW